MKRIIALILMIVTAFALASCSGTSTMKDSGGYMGAHSGSGGYMGAHDGSGGYLPAPEVGGDGDVFYGESIAYSKTLDGGEEGFVEGKETTGEKPDSERNQIRAGQITAKAWNDNENYAKWKKLFNEETANDPAGKFVEFKSGDWAIDTAKRVKVTVTQGESKVFGAKIVYYDSNQKKSTVRTDVNGVAYLFPGEDAGTITISSGNAEKTATFSAEEKDLTVDLADSQSKANVIKIMFVIDATGSMGDEMNYLAAELADVVNRVARQAENVKIDLALLFYRDDGDEEKFAYADFATVTESAGLQAQLNVLSRQYATGGGDYPEALDEALVLATGKNWGEENAARLMFVVLDAPPHEKKENYDRIVNAYGSAAEKGIAICPILCSGADTLTEYVTRTGALLTGGTSIFVTDDSGIGGSHLDPDLPDAVVEKLNDLLVRLIVGYHTGDFGTPVPYKGGQQTQNTEETPTVTGGETSGEEDGETDGSGSAEGSEE